MQQVKEPHARLWRDKPADRAGLHSSSCRISVTNTQAGPGREGEVTNPFCSPCLQIPVAHVRQAGLGLGTAPIPWRTLGPGEHLVHSDTRAKHLLISL